MLSGILHVDDFTSVMVSSLLRNFEICITYYSNSITNLDCVLLSAKDSFIFAYY